MPIIKSVSLVSRMRSIHIFMNKKLAISAKDEKILSGCRLWLLNAYASALYLHLPTCLVPRRHSLVVRGALCVMGLLVRGSLGVVELSRTGFFSQALKLLKKRLMFFFSRMRFKIGTCQTAQYPRATFIESRKATHLFCKRRRIINQRIHVRLFYFINMY